MRITYSRLGSYGRLGNQLFQIASTIGIAVKNDADFVFPEWEYSGDFFNKLPTGTVSGNHKEYVEPNYRYADVVLDRTYDWDLCGYFQSWKYFSNVDDGIKYYFSFEHQKRDGVAVHVRRGDYLHLQHIHPVLHLSYYLDAFNFFKGENFTIFSDDIEWCKHNFSGSHFTFHSTGRDIDDLKEMSSYRHIIIANSSFSWWSAYLSNASMIIAPKLYVNGEEIDDRIPDNWIKL